MQMTEETFLWLRSKIAADEDLAFADLYDPDTSIRFGCYYLHLCLERYNGDVATAAAAYHSGWALWTICCGWKSTRPTARRCRASPTVR